MFMHFVQNDFIQFKNKIIFLIKYIVDQKTHATIYFLRPTNLNIES